MKIEKLTDNKIRIILDIDELKQKNIDFTSLTENTDAAQKLFKKILKQAEKEVGFDPADSKILIEAFISSEGFFVLTFTKLNSELNSLGCKPLKLKVKRRYLHSPATTAIYKFDNFDEFCNFCTYSNGTAMGDLKGLAKTILLYEYNSSFFLIVSGINANYSRIALFYTSIAEFAKLVSNSSTFERTIREFGKVIFKNNAIRNGIKYFADV